MNDPVIERIAREDPAVGSRSDTASEMLARLRHEIGAADEPPTRVPVRRRLSRVAAPASAALVAVAVAAAAIGLPGHRARRSSSPARPALPVSAVAVGSVSVAPGTETMLAHEGSLWIAGAHALERLNPVNGAVEARIRLPIEGLAAGLAFGAGSGWVASGGANTGSAPSLVRIDPANGRVLAAIDVTGSGAGRLRVLSGGISFAAGRVWLSRDSTGSHGDVISVNPAGNRVDGRPITVGTGPGTVLAAFGSLWVDNTGLTVGRKPAPALPASTARIDPRTRRVTTEPISGASSAGFGSLWVRHDDTITRYDPSTDRPIARIQVPRVIAIAFGDGRVWAVSRSVNTSDASGTALLTQIDPRSNSVVGGPRHLQSPEPVAVAVSGHDLWIADYQRGLLHLELTDHPGAGTRGTVRSVHPLARAPRRAP
jgi:hypothetical protein